jgi:hypothetical protein
MGANMSTEHSSATRDSKRLIVSSKKSFKRLINENKTQSVPGISHSSIVGQPILAAAAFQAALDSLESESAG